MAGVPENSPVGSRLKIQMPTSTMAFMGRFPSPMGGIPTLMGRFLSFVLRGRFASWKSTGQQPIKKRGVKRFLISRQGASITWCDVLRPEFAEEKRNKKQKYHITSHPWTFKTSTSGITCCDNFQPTLRLEVAAGFHIRWRMLAGILAL